MPTLTFKQHSQFQASDFLPITYAGFVCARLHLGRAVLCAAACAVSRVLPRQGFHTGFAGRSSVTGPISSKRRLRTVLVLCCPTTCVACTPWGALGARVHSRGPASRAATAPSTVRVHGGTLPRPWLAALRVGWRVRGPRLAGRCASSRLASPAVRLRTDPSCLLRLQADSAQSVQHDGAHPPDVDGAHLPGVAQERICNAALVVGLCV